MEGNSRLMATMAGAAGSEAGFFEKFNRKTIAGLKDEQVERFGKLQTDEERFLFAAALPAVQQLQLGPPDCGGKDLQAALEAKQMGNDAFRAAKYELAATHYGRGMILCPAERSDLLAILCANRSAAMSALEEHHQCISDVDFAMAAGYPPQMLHKVVERKARSLEAVGQHRLAAEELGRSLAHLEHSDLPAPRRETLRHSVLERMRALEADGCASPAPEDDPDLLVPARHALYTALSDRVDIRQEAAVGRHAVAVEAIRPGEAVLVERPFGAVLLAAHAGTHCWHCLRRTRHAYPCSWCVSAAFCSAACKAEAEAGHHGSECSIARLLLDLEASIICTMALRMLTLQRPADVVAFVTGDSSVSRLAKYESSQYATAYNLVRNADQRDPVELLPRALMAAVLFRILCRSPYLPEDAPPAWHHCLGGLLLRHLQILQFNAHEVSELIIDGATDEAKSIFIGGAVYPTLALFNHSCEPSVIRYFVGSTVVVRAVTSISAGSEIGENYGPIYSGMPIAQRRQQLRQRYLFDCGCQPCQQAWPMFADMRNDVLTMRCQRTGCHGTAPLGGGLCSGCGAPMDSLVTLKQLEKTDEMFRLADNAFEEGQLDEAVAKYSDILSILVKYLKVPFPDYVVCQQKIRNCMMRFGNKIVLD